MGNNSLRLWEMLDGLAPADPPLAAVARRQVVERICARVVLGDVLVDSAELPLGGVQVWTHGAETAGPGARWVIHQRMARRLTRVGWHVEADSGRVLVLGWSARCLTHRVRLLQAALRGPLTDFEQTAGHAVSVAVRLHARRDTHPASRTSIVTATCASTAELLYWPQELADLAGAERSSAVERLQLLLAQVMGLEAKVAQACQAHVIYSRVLAGMVYDYLARGAEPELAQRQALATARPWLRASQLLSTSTLPDSGPLPAVAGGPPAGLAERRVAVSVPNHGEPVTGAHDGHDISAR